jgi:hypothetical protein
VLRAPARVQAAPVRGLWIHVWGGEVVTSGLSPAKKAVLDRWRTGRLTAGRHHAIEHDPQRTSFPLSVRQREMWSYELLYPRTPSNTIYFCAKVRGHLDESAFREGLGRLIDRHAALRTIVVGGPGEEQQVVLPSVETPLDVVDLTHLPVEDAEQEALRQADAIVATGFDLSPRPPHRGVLYRLGGESRLLFLQIHHIVADGWSLGVALGELSAIYEALIEGRDPSLPPLPIQYGDWAVWEHEWLRGQDLAATQGEYWAPRLRPAPAVDLGYDHPDGDRSDLSGGSVEMMIPEELTAAIRRASRECGVTPFMFLAGAVAAQCKSLGGADRLAIDLMLANRVLPEIHGLVGMFSNTLPLWIDVSGDPSFRELLGRVHSASTAVYATQQVPIEALEESLGIERGSDGTRIAQVELVFHNWPLEVMNLGAAKLERIDLKEWHSFHDFEFHLWDGPSTVDGFVDYKTSLYEEASIREKLGVLQRMFGDAARNPDCRLSELMRR